MWKLILLIIIIIFAPQLLKFALSLALLAILAILLFGFYTLSKEIIKTIGSLIKKIIRAILWKVETSDEELDTMTIDEWKMKALEFHSKKNR